MARIVIDFETTSTVDLRRTGVHAYSEHPDTRITVLCFAVDDNPVETWLSGPPPAEFVKAITTGATVIAHNFLFELNIYVQKLVPQGWPAILLRQWSCTMARCLVAGWPASLDLAGQVLGLTHQKDRSAHDLMLRFARPRSTNPLVWWDQSDPVRFQKLIDYCRQDVLTERELDKALPELSDRERAAFEIDHAINQAGIGIDLDLVDRLSKLTTQAQHELRDKIALLTGGQVRSLNQVQQLRMWLFDNHGLVLDNLRRATVQAELPHTSGPVRTVLQARLDASRSSTAKLGAIAASRSRDDRVASSRAWSTVRTGPDVWGSSAWTVARRRDRKSVV